MRLLAIVALALAGCTAGAPGPGIDVERALGHARALVELGPRDGETPAAKRAADYIAHELGAAAERREVGVVELPAITVMGRTYRAARRTMTTDPNIVARYGPAAGKALLVMAHYDTVRASPGAIDNAAAVGVLLELARVLAAEPPPHPVILAFTAREEDGLIGAEALAAQLGDHVAVAIALDLVGGDGDLVVNGAGMHVRRAELRWLARAAERAGVVLRVPLAHRVVSRWWPQAERSDHGAFIRRGIRGVHFYHRGHDGEFIDRAYHTPRDRFERIEPAAVHELGRLLRALVATAPPAPDSGDGFAVPVLANVIVPRALLVGFEVALVLAALWLLVRMRRARGDRSSRRAGLLASVACFAAAASAAYAVERALLEHPQQWLHAPGTYTIALSLVLVGVLGLLSRGVARLAPWTGAQRYLAVAIVLLLAPGAALLALGAAELAWIWLVPAAVASSAPALPRALRLFALAPTLLPALLVLAPAQLREAAWNGFAPPGLPLVGWILVVGIPPVAAAGYWLRDRGHSGPLGAFVIPVGWALAIGLGLLMLLRDEPPCTPAEFQRLHLGCELVPGV